ncbi:MAG: thrombospondin type 3 repeat-containing protein [Flavobacteriales bacterium]|nr:thrombospondin type 3 repeat-containing protein [Flavobacteriales bacterium]
MAQNYYADSDADGFGAGAAIPGFTCAPPPNTVTNNTDGCPADPLKQADGACGCGNIDTDTDGDATADCIDGCPADPLKVAAGACGCGSPETDTDSDGTADCIDGCPTDPLKIAPGVCGCAVADTDADNDGIADCNDDCPNTPGEIGFVCNDGNATTGNDVVGTNCVCVGQLIDCAGVPGGSGLPGTACQLGAESGTWSVACHCVVPRPDIAVQNVTAAPTVITPGETVTIDWSVSNIGTAPSTKTWTERIYAESSTGQNRTLLKQSAFSEAGMIGIGGSITRSDAVLIPTQFNVADVCRFVVELVPGAGLVELAGTTANNTGIQSTTWTITKLLALQLSATQVVEGSSTPISVTVLRSGSVAIAEVVSMSLTEAQRFSFPATVTILAGQAGKTFTVLALENGALEGPVQATMTVSATGYPSVQQGITVLDNEVPALGIANLPATRMEGDNFTFQITTTFAPTAPLQVFLTSSNNVRFPFLHR